MAEEGAGTVAVETEKAARGPSEGGFVSVNDKAVVFHDSQTFFKTRMKTNIILGIHWESQLK